MGRKQFVPYWVKGMERAMEEKKGVRPIPGLGREEEEQQLEEIIKVAQENLVRTEGYVRGLSDELHDLMETYGTKDKEALLLLRNTQTQLSEYSRALMRCQKARKKPYFGRIDFKDPRQPAEESYYVGRVGISTVEGDPVVIDWRAPVASVYYENTMGLCRYVVKSEGIYEIDLRRKRTYEIEKDKLKDFFDSDVVANDELLTKYLAKSKKAVLGEIIATIQKEQNAIIRKSPKINLIVQGVAGSGKTTVAMHRISYILYNYKKEFRPEDFYIIGSNRILLNYITGVLPDLDVYGVSQMTMEQLFVRLLYEDWNSGVYKISPIDRRNKKLYIKGSREWFRDLEEFCGEYEDVRIPKKEIRLEKSGALLVGEATIRNYLESNRQTSMQSKINMLNEILLSKLENELAGKYVSYTPEEKKELKRAYRWYFGKDVWKGSIFEVYQEFLQTQRQRGKEVPDPGNAFDIYDLAALAYLYKRIKETDGIREASHVIIDEAQDFGMMAYAALKYCLRGCTYTIMGDVSQNIHFGYGLNDWEGLRELMLTGLDDSFGVLKKSYRNTVEISDFAAGILRHGSFSVYPAEPISRHGNEVRIRECRDDKAMIQETADAIEGWQREGYETIAVICRDAQEASEVSGLLGEKMAVADSDPETTEFGSGVMVLPVEYTKGLEFDAVILYHPSAESYPAEDPYVKLLYVAATRALHELTVVHQGDLTDLIAKPADREKCMRSLEKEEKQCRRRCERKEITAREQAALDAIQGEKERAARSYLGPKPIVVRQAKGQKDHSDQGRLNQGQLSQGQLTPGALNASPFRFREVPDSSVLTPRGHGRIDNSVRIVRKTKRYIDLISSYGTLRLTPLEDAVVRVQFRKGGTEEFEAGCWNYRPKALILWAAKEGRNLVEVSTEKLKIRVDKKTGALQFLDGKEKELLAEKAALPRQVEASPDCQTWVYFDWPKSEKLSAKGILPDDLEPMNHKARYISFGGKRLRMPLLVSSRGYGIGVAARRTVLCCDIPMYGTYLYADGEKQIDYYFLYGGDYKATLELYKKL